MKLRFQHRPGDDVGAVWLLAILILGAGFYFIESHFERNIAATRDRTESLYRRMVANERIVQQATMLTRVQSVALHDLERVSHETSLSLTTAAMVSALDRSATTYHTEVTGVEPEAAAPRPATDLRLADSGLQMTALTIKVRGKFRNLLQFIEALSHDRTLISVSDTQLSLGAGEDGRPEPKLDATIHATMYRLRLPSQNQEVRVAANR